MMMKRAQRMKSNNILIAQRMKSTTYEEQQRLKNTADDTKIEIIINSIEIEILLFFVASLIFGIENFQSTMSCLVINAASIQFTEQINTHCTF